jgi:alkaline phosphatase
LKANCSDIDNDDIAEQLILGNVGRNLKVIMGGGRQEFQGTELDPETGVPGKRTDGKNLIQDWIFDGIMEKEKRQYVWNRTEMMKIDVSATDRILGLFEPSHCQYNLDVKHKELTEEPSLAEMTDKATDLLKKSGKGFFLFVEGGRIDHGHHDTQARYALDETVEFAKAIELTRNKFSEEDTLIVVTSDHAHTMSYSGYPVSIPKTINFYCH